MFRKKLDCQPTIVVNWFCVDEAKESRKEIVTDPESPDYVWDGKWDHPKPARTNEHRRVQGKKYHTLPRAAEFPKREKRLWTELQLKIQAKQKEIDKLEQALKEEAAVKELKEQERRGEILLPETSISKIAKRLGVSYNSAYIVLTGRKGVSLATLKEYSKLLSVDMQFFLDLVEVGYWREQIEAGKSASYGQQALQQKKLDKLRSDIAVLEASEKGNDRD